MSIGTPAAQLLRKLECPVCNKTCTPPIYRCTNGHSVCVKCQPHLKACRTCQAPGRPTMRSIKLEKIAEIDIPCSNQQHGCALTFNLDKMADHLLNCDHGFTCHVCKVFKGTVKGIKKHVTKKHQSHYFQCSSTGCITQKTNIPTNKKFHDTPYFYMFSFNKDIFWLEDEYNSTTRIFSRTLRIISHDDKEALRYYYSMEFKSKDKLSQNRVYCKVDVEKEGDNCGDMNIIIPENIVNSYQDGKIEYILQISLKSGVISLPEPSEDK